MINRHSFKFLTAPLYLTLILHAHGAMASIIKCQIETHSDAEKVKTLSLICGEFVFEAESLTPRRQIFTNCPELILEYKINESANGNKYSLNLSSSDIVKTKKHNFKGSVSFITRAFPDEFQIERSVPRKVGKHILFDEQIVDCHLQK